MRSRAMTVAAGVLTAGLALSACSAEVSVGGGGDPVIKEQNLEEQMSDKLMELTGMRPESIDCPGDLGGDVDTTLRCTLSGGGQRYGMTVTVTGIDTEKQTLRYDLQVDDQALREGETA